MLEHLLQRELVIALAVVGAVVSTLGSWTRSKNAMSPWGMLLHWGGYGVTGVSVLLFVLAGLLGYPPSQ